ncbi:MAG: gamma-glutamyltransferase family protein [Candidatus Limnocylindrales bacterium]
MSAALVPTTPAYGRHGAVVSPHRLASEAGLGILRAGGSAVDAAIATNAALAVVASHSCGLGGDAFWLIWDGTALAALNGSGRSGEGATLEAARRAVKGTRLPLLGPWTVTVPGAIRSWGDAHERHGRLPWADLLGPAIELAEGFPATPGWIAATERGAALYGTGSDWARVFRARGRPWRLGERVVITGLAATLRRIAAEGPAETYSGRLAQRAARYLAARGAPISAADLAAHRSTWAEPIETGYRGVTATSHPPNSCGVLALELLNILECVEAPAADAFGPDGVQDPRWVHLCLEAARQVLADRDRWLTDQEWMEPGALSTMLSKEHAGELAARLDPSAVRVPRRLRAPRGGGTVYLAAVDRWGAAVSLIESNYAGFGCGLADPQTGIAYQNRGAFFSLDPRHPNALAPHKRTMHTLTPGMLFRGGRPWLVHGSMGGEIQPQIFAQFVSAMVDGGLDIATAIAAPRWSADVVRHHGPPSVTRLEARIPAQVAAGLEARGHRLSWGTAFDGAFGHEHAIELVWPAASSPVRPTGAVPALAEAVAAATDPRSEGAPGVW